MTYLRIKNRDQALTVYYHEIDFNKKSELYFDEEYYYVAVVQPDAHEECECFTEVEFSKDWEKLK